MSAMPLTSRIHAISEYAAEAIIWLAFLLIVHDISYFIAYYHLPYIINHTIERTFFVMASLLCQIGFGSAVARTVIVVFMPDNEEGYEVPGLLERATRTMEGWTKIMQGWIDELEKV